MQIKTRPPLRRLEQTLFFFMQALESCSVPQVRPLWHSDRSIPRRMQLCTQAAAARRVLEATLTTAKRLQSIRKDAVVFADVLQEMVRTQLDSLTPGSITVVPAGWAYEKGSPHIVLFYLWLLSTVDSGPAHFTHTTTALVRICRRRRRDKPARCRVAGAPPNRWDQIRVERAGV